MKNIYLSIGILGTIAAMLYFMPHATPAPVGAPTIAPVVRKGPAEVYPNSTMTPGVTNPDITQDTISKTICNSAWSTKSIRPPSSYTSALKVKQIAAYGFTDTNPADYEEDHLISLELGGSPTDPKNLWPEAYPVAHHKDTVENMLHSQVCSGTISLAQAQQEISTDWYAVYTATQTYGGIEVVNDPDDE